MDVIHTRAPLHARDADPARSAVSGVSMRGSRFSDVSLGGASFENVDFADSRFVNARLAGAAFENVSFAGARFRDGDLSAVDIRNCNVTGMRIDGIEVMAPLAAYRKNT